MLGLIATEKFIFDYLMVYYTNKNKNHNVK